jgi:hypothetical protein
MGREAHSNYCKKHYIEHSKMKQRARYYYFNGTKFPKYFHNKKTGKKSLYKEDLTKQYKDDFILTTMIWNQIEKEAKQQGLVGVFTTSTVNGELHPFGGNSEVLRANYDYELNPKRAYAELQDLHTKIRRQAHRDFGYAPSFIKATEFHKSFMPHNHLVYFVKPEDVDRFVNILDNKAELLPEIGLVETEVLNKEGENNSALAYLLKYLTKSAHNATNEEVHLLDGWKRALGIRQLYSNSRLTLPKWVIKKARYYFGETTITGEVNKDYWKDSYDSLYDCIRDNVKVIDKTYDIDNNFLRNKVIEPLRKEKIRIERDRTVLLQFIEVNGNPFLLRTAYKTKRFIVKRINKHSEYVLYNKDHYEMLEVDMTNVEMGDSCRLELIPNK